MDLAEPDDLVDPLTAKIKEREERNDNRINRIANSRRRRQVRRLRDSSAPLIRRLDTKGIGDPERGIVGIVIKGRRDVGNRYVRLSDSEPRERNEYNTGERLSHINGIALPSVNTILDYFGFPDGSPRNSFLKSFNDDTHYGAEIVRAAYQLAAFFGMKGKYDETPEQIRQNFVAIAKQIYQKGTPFTDTLLELAGYENIAQVVNHVPMKIGRKMALVPRSEVSRMEEILSRVPKNRHGLPSTLSRYDLQKMNDTMVYNLPK